MREPAVWRARIALAALVIWGAAILYLDLTSANPPIVARPQVLSSDALVEGTLEVGPVTRLKPDKLLWSRRPLELSDLPADGVIVEAQKATWIQTGARAIAPLQEIAPERFAVTPLEFESPTPRIDPESGPAPIYPATNVVRRQLEPLLKKNVP